MNAAGLLITLLAALAYSTKAIFAKLAYRYDVDAQTLLNLRMLFSLPFFGVLLYWSRNSRPRTPPKALDHLKIASLGLLGFYLSSILDFEGLRYISANLERIIVFSYPSLVVVLSALLYGRWISRRDRAALIMSYLGLVLACLGDVRAKDMTIGCSLVLGCAASYALYLTLSEPLIRRLGTVYFTSYVLAVATVAMTGVTLWQHPDTLFTQQFEVYRLAIGMAVISTVAASILMSEGIKRVGAPKASVVGTVGPIATIYMSHIFLGERLFAEQAVGGLLVMLGVVLLAGKTSG